MNIFILDEEIPACARYHCDQHVVKMILESVQLLCTTLNKKGYETPYRSTHIKHPCVLWVEESWSNFIWLRELAIALNDEYCLRFDKGVDHKSMQVLPALADLHFEDRGLTEFAQAMPEEYKVPGNAVLAYRNFYRGEKAAFARWTLRERPAWMDAS